MSKKIRKKEKKIVVHLEGDTRKFVSRYVRDMKKHVKCCRDWIQSKDFEKIGEFAHTLKGSGSAMGLVKISEFGRVLEKAVQKKNWQGIKKSVAQLSGFLTLLKVIYDKRPSTSG